MPQTVASPGLGPNPLQRRLASLRRRLRCVVGLRGAGWLLTAVLAGALACGLLDWRWHLPGLVRALFLVGTLSAAGYVIYRHLFLPLTARTDDLALAFRVEEQHSGLDDCLASTVEFLQQPADSEQYGSPGLRREAVRRALRRMEGCDFGKVIERRGLFPAVLAALACLALAGTALTLYPAAARTAFWRLAVPFGGEEWPRQTQLEIDPPRERIGRNEAFEVRARVRGVVPDEAVVTFQLDGSQVAEHTCTVQRDEASGTGTFATVLKPDQVQRRFRFQVRANDAVSRWYEVAVLAPPKLESLRVRLEPPAYTDLPAHHLPDGIGDVEAVTGTRIILRAGTDRPLIRAWVEFEPEPWFAADHVQAELTPDRRGLTVGFLPPVGGRYVLHVEDEAGLRNSRLSELSLGADPPPLVNLERPSSKRDILDVLPTAELPLAALVEDPQYAVRTVWLEYRVRQGARGEDKETRRQGDKEIRRLTLYDHRAAGEVAAGLLGFSPCLPVSLSPCLALPPARLREKRLEINQRLALGRLPGVKLTEGDVLTLQVCADDFDDVTPGKPPGRSHEVEVRIVNRDALDVILAQEQDRVRQELARLREQERDAIKKVADTQSNLRQKGRLDGEDVGRLQQAEQLQEQIRERVGSRRLEGLRREVERILEGLRNNQLPRSAVHDRMRQVGDQLDRLAREELEPIESRLSSARRQTESPEEQSQQRQRQAQQLEQLAEERDREAREADRLAAERPEGDAGKKLALTAAKLMRQQAEELRQAARGLREGREQQPPERERRTRLLEELAQEKEHQATRAEQAAAGRPETDPARAVAEEEARRQRQEAQQLKQTAQEMRQGASGANDAREQLAEARRHQEEVEKTLTDLLDRVLDRFASTVEIKSEAKTILQEQRRLLQQTEELNKQLLQLSEEQKPTDQQRAQLDQIKDDQGRLEGRTHQLLEKMEQVQKERDQKQDHETARQLREALKSARDAQGGTIAGRMNDARTQLQGNKLNEAAQSQRAGIKQLEELVKQLDDQREAELDRLAKKLRELEKELEQIAEEQERLQKKIKEAAGLADPQQRAEAMKQLADRQAGLKQRADRVAEQMARMRLGRAGQEMAQAAAQMDDALRKLERGQNPEEQQEEALDRLDEARREMEQARQQVEEELAREQLAKIADTLKRLRERQQVLIDEAARIQRELKQRDSSLWRSLLFSLGALALNQKNLGQETANEAENKLAGAQVFHRILQRSAQAMTEASAALGKHRKQVEKLSKPETADGAEAARLQQEALRRLDQLLAALEEPEAARRPMGGDQGGMQGDEGGRPPGDSIPTLAQLKLLRALQTEVNQRTDAFHQKHPDLSKLTPQEQAELQAIRRDQQDVADLLDMLTRPDNPEGDRP